jgi:hypothetical protein
MGEGPFTRRFARLNKTDQKPVARTDELVVEELGEELLVYDQNNDTAHSLGVVAARVWRACDGETSAQDLSARLDLDADTVTRALEELDECNLLDNGGQLDGMTRREATLKGAKIGAGIASAPLIYSILAPVPALASTQAYCLSLGCVQDCGDCHKGGCACCGPGNPQVGASKLCTQDCSSTFCTIELLESHCNVPQQSSSACNTSDARLKREIRPLTLPVELLS